MLAGVSRGTVSRYFPDRRSLLKATIENVCEWLVDEVWPEGDMGKGDLRITEVGLHQPAARLAEFTLQNAGFCRVWLRELLSSDKPGIDPFSRAGFASVRAFCNSQDAAGGIDAEAYAATTLMAFLLWPGLKHDEHLSPLAQRAAAGRLADEVLRGAMYGMMNWDHFRTVRKALGVDGMPTHDSEG
jgi:AcrR family transcriptional regulator